ncbi:fluoride efflux transporter family protein [Corynebacterium diphtheriae]|uniref:Fluoride-specific ion channel FluC 1 n=2 Tax=Corynebacterium diphtheriae TaxID=1717 RepID=FLUC1_CORDI|nr:fluoride efflux transporter family protein [Corynebacterium diphtheriae]P61388.1 RecName: Full=Fluoride-specific ion channel FluC 1 [Corynebacterium diphtheriae NCTC 13129]ARB87973.1 fluoride ion transporter CrcB [Corynebacterium diphtheriae]KKA80691.1 chromosome condensation protein CrcB [Corynebacterium diphtheriae]MBG9249146.1 fluoride efflux transporter family protein [Corynebacterium diphtheriae bv. gravis]MBG9297552.1 fluoride efflux transporter family protein [Corynebacterium diphthe
MQGVLVGLGAGLGAISRYQLSMLIDAPLALLGINLLGSFLMGWLRPNLLWGTGFLGGFTSFSAFALLMFDGAYLYAAVTVIGCVAAWLLGDRFAA